MKVYKTKEHKLSSVAQVNLLSSASAILLESTLSGPFRIQAICPDGPQTYIIQAIKLYFKKSLSR